MISAQGNKISMAILVVFALVASAFGAQAAGRTLEIAPPDQALTFAKAGDRLIVVTAYGNGEISGVLIADALNVSSDDPIELFNAVGYSAIQQALSGVDPTLIVSVAAAELGIPVRLADQHIAAGTNFAAHAEEASVEDGPFLFAKMVTPTAPVGTVSNASRLLDYEVELAYVTLGPAALDARPQTMGLILCNDFTDRAALVRNVNLSDVTSGDGFTTGKSAPGFLPVSNLFVIPRNLDDFVASLNLQLSVNGLVRQDASMALAIWDIDEIFRQTQAIERRTWDYRGQQVRLPLTDSVIPSRTLVMTGTPAGVLFQGVPTMDYVSAAASWAFGGWNRPITDWVIETYVAARMADNSFLQTGDVVVIQAPFLGVIETTVVE
jgi:2-keto-4-pentenoate hydratase/2-oxohepta-3-ene-1,7-dioic acid hydratase in catechol pathway